MNRLQLVTLKFIKYTHSIQNNYTLIKCYLRSYRKILSLIWKNKQVKIQINNMGKGKQYLYYNKVFKQDAKTLCGSDSRNCTQVNRTEQRVMQHIGIYIKI